MSIPRLSSRHRQARPPWRAQRQRPRPWRLVFVGLVLAFAGVGVFALGFTWWLVKDLPDPNRLTLRDVPLTTKIYDRTGQTVLYEIHGAQRRTLVKLADIPEHLKWATIVAEDREFYQHRGFRISSIVRATLANLVSRRRVQGGSTLTQQLVKNAILTPERTYRRKIKEVMLAQQIERRFSKDEILQLYFNEIPYGSNAYGVAAAADSYFGKPVGDLSVAEAAVLAALPKAPTNYSPYSQRDRLIARQRYVLDSMVETGHLDADAAAAAKTEPLNFRPPAQRIIAPHFVFHVKELLVARYGERVVETGGLRVITTLDRAKQTLAEEVVAAGAEKNLAHGATNAALAALDTATGQILAMVGSKDFFNQEIDGEVNVVTRPRQPGSSFKPIVYAAAFRRGYTPNTVLYDVVTAFTNYDRKPYEPKNYTLKEYGPVTMRTALAGSLNIPAVKTIYLAGIGNVLQLAEELGYTTLKPRSRFGLSLVLGGGEVTLLEHLNAFATLAREGDWLPAAAILEVTDPGGKILEEHRPRRTKVLETQIARQITSILSDNEARTFIFGANSHLTLPDRPVAAKTGTTNDYRDAWTIGYTPNLAAGVWVGNNDNTEMKRGADGSVVAAPIWNAFMRQALAGTAAETFRPPDPVVTGKPVLDGTSIDGVKVAVDRISGKRATEYTPARFREERTYLVPHTILHEVKPDDPRGPPPTEAERDPEYAAWEAAVQRWAKDQRLTLEEPPTAVDDVHVPANAPAVRWLSPAAGVHLASRQLQLAVWAAAPRGVSRVEFWLNDVLVGESRQEPFGLQIYVDDPAFTNGAATLRATAYDDVDNAGNAAITVGLGWEPIAAGSSWVSPRDGAIVETKQFPLLLQLNLARPGQVTKVDVFAANPDGTTQFVNSVRQIQPTVTIPWVRPAAVGIVRLHAQITNADGFAYRGPYITIEVK